MEQVYQTTEIDKTKLVGEFYYSLALLQTKAIDYVARGETEDDKLGRVKEIIKIVKETGNEIPDVKPIPLTEECNPPCYWDLMLGMCMCTHEVSPH